DRLNPQWRRVRLHIPELVDPYLWPWEYIPDPPPNWLPVDWRRAVTQPLISVIATVGLDEQIAVQSVMRVDAVARLDGAQITQYALQLIGGEGAPVAETPLLRLPSHGGSCCQACGGTDDDRPPFLVQGLLPDTEPGSELRIVARDA